MRRVSDCRIPSATSRLVPWIISCQSTRPPRSRASSASSGSRPAGSVRTRSTSARASYPVVPAVAHEVGSSSPGSRIFSTST